MSQNPPPTKAPPVNEDVLRLTRQLRRTRLGCVLSLGVVGVSAYYLGTREGATFPTVSSLDPRQYFPAKKENDGSSQENK